MPGRLSLLFEVRNHTTPHHTTPHHTTPHHTSQESPPGVWWCSRVMVPHLLPSVYTAGPPTAGQGQSAMQGRGGNLGGTSAVFGPKHTLHVTQTEGGRGGSCLTRMEAGEAAAFQASLFFSRPKCLHLACCSDSGDDWDYAGQDPRGAMQSRGGNLGGTSAVFAQKHTLHVTQTQGGHRGIWLTRVEVTGETQHRFLGEKSGMLVASTCHVWCSFFRASD